MLRKEITYTNFNDETVTRPFFFNLTKGELTLRELESDGGLSKALTAIQGSNQGSVVLPEFRKIIKWCYGVKSADGETFEKSDAIWARFEGSEAWSALIMELLTDADYAGEFINSVLPAELVAAGKEEAATSGFRPGSPTERPTPPNSRREAIAAEGHVAVADPVVDPSVQHDSTVREAWGE